MNVNKADGIVGDQIHYYVRGIARARVSKIRELIRGRGGHTIGYRVLHEDDPIAAAAVGAIVRQDIVDAPAP